MKAQSQNLMFERLQHVVDMATILYQQNNYQEILRIVSQKLSLLLNADLALLFMLNPRTQQTVKTIVKAGQAITRTRYHAVLTQISGWMMKYNRSLLSEDIKNDHRFSRVEWRNFPFRSVIGAPIEAEGLYIGSFILFRKKGQFEETDLLFMEKMIFVAAPYLRNIQKIQDYFEAPLPESVLLTRYQGMGLLGKSEPFIKLLHAIDAAARCHVRVLLEGENGTGKELVAHAIHKQSDRHSHSFVAVDCGAIPDNLIESELFGHVKGAFTGATTDRKGLMEEANGGTLFMDEINNLPYEMQSKLLRVLQEGEVRPVGSNKPRKINVRVIAASSVSLNILVKNHSFREDLYYRLHVYPLYMPTLDERQKDIPVLANHFLAKFAQQQEKAAKSFHGSLLNFMRHRHWAGNVRELENFVERLVTLTPSDSTMLNPDILPDEFRKEFKKLSINQEIAPLEGKSLAETLKDVEEQIIRRTLQDNGWKQRKTARILGISEGTLRYKMKKYEMNESKTIS